MSYAKASKSETVKFAANTVGRLFFLDISASRVRSSNADGSELMRQSTREHLEQAAKSESEEFSALLRTPDNKEAITAFFEKRQPDFTRKRKHDGRVIPERLWSKRSNQSWAKGK